MDVKAEEPKKKPDCFGVFRLTYDLKVVESGMLTEPLWDVAKVLYPNNGMFICDYTIKLLSSSFPNMTTTEVAQFVDRLFKSINHPPSFKDCIRDFLVKSKEFSAQRKENSPLTEVEPYILFNINPTRMQPVFTTSYLLAFPSFVASLIGSRLWEHLRDILNPEFLIHLEVPLLRWLILKCAGHYVNYFRS
ncbi:hypothetical protein OROHE_009583 [Orobanche hederae]